MDNFDLKKYLTEGRLFEEDMTSKAVSVLKSYKGEVKGLEDYIKYLMNTSDDISSSIQAVADDMDRDNDAEDSLRRDLEKLSLAEGKLNEEIKLNILPKNNIAILKGDSGKYEGFIEDGEVSFSTIYDDLDYRITDQYDESNIEDFLGKGHAFVELAKKYDYNWDIEPDLVGITIKLKDLNEIIDLVHVKEPDGSLYGTGSVVKVEKDKTWVRFDGNTIKKFDSNRVVPVQESQDPGARLGPGPKAGPDGVNDNYYVKAFKYKLVPKNKKGTYVQPPSTLPVRKLWK